jgi:hypothetical protein
MTLRIEKTMAEAWLLRNGHDQAQIFVRSGYYEPDRGWVSVSIMSSFGNFGYHWNHIGPGPWWRFLFSLNRQYAMEKFMGNSYLVEDIEKTILVAKENITERRRDGELSKEEAKEAWEALTNYDSVSMESLIERLSHTKAFREDYYDIPRYSPSPQAIGFWDTFWRPWVAEVVLSRTVKGHDEMMDREAL